LAAQQQQQQQQQQQPPPPPLPQQPPPPLPQQQHQQQLNIISTTEGRNFILNVSSNPNFTRYTSGKQVLEAARELQIEKNFVGTKPFGVTFGVILFYCCSILCYLFSFVLLSQDCRRLRWQ